MIEDYILYMKYNDMNKLVMQYINKNTGKVEKTEDIDGKMNSMIRIKEFNNYVIGIFKKEDGVYLCRKDNNLNDMWSIKITDNIENKRFFLDLFDKDNAITISEIEVFSGDKEGEILFESKLYRYVFK